MKFKSKQWHALLRSTTKIQEHTDTTKSTTNGFSENVWNRSLLHFGQARATDLFGTVSELLRSRSALELSEEGRVRCGVKPGLSVWLKREWYWINQTLDQYWILYQWFVCHERTLYWIILNHYLTKSYWIAIWNHLILSHVVTTHSECFHFAKAQCGGCGLWSSLVWCRGSGRVTCKTSSATSRMHPKGFMAQDFLKQVVGIRFRQQRSWLLSLHFKKGCTLVKRPILIVDTSVAVGGYCLLSFLCVFKLSSRARSWRRCFLQEEASKHYSLTFSDFGSRHWKNGKTWCRSREQQGIKLETTPGKLRCTIVWVSTVKTTRK